MTDTTHPQRHRGGLIWLASVVALAGLVLVVVALVRQVPSPPTATSAGRIEPPATQPQGGAAASRRPRTDRSVDKPAAPTPLPASKPVQVSIPSIGVRSAVIALGLAKNGTLAVPQPGPNLNKVAWFDRSPTPGQSGPSVLEGHVDTVEGPSVFYRLGELAPGDTIEVTRADGIRVTFTVDAVRIYPKDDFPTKAVYGAKDLSRPQLRVITCANFDRSIGHYTGNEVVYASLTRTERVRSLPS